VNQSRVDALRSGDLNWSDAVPLQQLNTLERPFVQLRHVGDGRDP